MNFFEIIKAIYQKNAKVLEDAKIDYNLIVALNKWLSYDKDNLEILKENLKYMFYILPPIYFYLLFLTIPRKEKPPFLEKIEKKKEDENKYADIKKYFGWSKRELEIYKKYL